MKKLSFFEKFLFLVNSLLAFSFLISLGLPHVKPTLFSYSSIFSLFTPIIISLNILFMIFHRRFGRKINKKLAKNQVKTLPKASLNPPPKTWKLVINQ